MKRLRCKLAVKMVTFIVVASFLWSNLVYAGGDLLISRCGLNEGIDKLAAQCQLPDISRPAEMFYDGIALHSELITRDCTNLRRLYENQERIREVLRQKLGDEANDLYTLVFSDDNDPQEVAYYTLDLNPGAYYCYRCTRKGSVVNNPLERLIRNGLREYKDRRAIGFEHNIGGDEYLIEVLPITEEIAHKVSKYIDEFYERGKTLPLSPRLHRFPKYITDAIKKMESKTRGQERIIEEVSRYDEISDEIIVERKYIPLLKDFLSDILGKEMKEEDIEEYLNLHEQIEREISILGDKFIEDIYKDLCGKYGEKFINNLLCAFDRNYGYLSGRSFGLEKENLNLTKEERIELLRELLVHTVVERRALNQPVRVLPPGYKDTKEDRVPIEEHIEDILLYHAMLNGLMPIPRSEAYRNVDIFRKYIFQRINEKLKGRMDKMEGLIDKWKRIKETYDERVEVFGRESKIAKTARRLLDNAERKINEIIDEVNLMVDRINDIEFASVKWVDSFIKGNDYKDYKEELEKLVLEGKYVPEFFFSGAATRMGKGVMYNLDLYEFAKELKLEIPQNGIIGLGMGVRQILQYRLFLENLARKKGYNPEEILRNAKMVIHTNVIIENSEDSIVNDLIKHKFYGFNPENIIFLAQDTSKGHKIVNGKIVLAEESEEMPIGHGYATMQLNQPGHGFIVRRDGTREYLQESVLDFLIKNGAELLVVHRVNDATKWAGQVVEVDKLSFALKLFKRGFNVVIPLVGNPGKQKGGQIVKFKNSDRKFLLEKRNANTPELKPFWGLTEEAPYNAMRNIYKLKDLPAILSGGLPCHLRFFNGYLYIENQAGDLTLNREARTEGIIKGKEKSKRELIQDTKTTKDIKKGVEFYHKQDSNPMFKEMVVTDIEINLRWIKDTLREKNSKTGLEEGTIESVINAFREGKLKLSGIFLDVIYINEHGEEEILCKLDREIVHKAGLMHRTSNAFIVAPDGKVILQRRAPWVTYGLCLSIYGGHVPSGKNYRATIKEKIRGEARLPEGWELKGLFEEVRGEGVFGYSGNIPEESGGGLNNERRSLYIYYLTDEEYDILKHEMSEIENLKKISKKEKDAIERLRAEGMGDVWSIHEFDISEIKGKDGLTVEDKFNHGSADFSEDLLKGLAADKGLMEEIEKAISIGQLKRFIGCEPKIGINLWERILGYYKENPGIMSTAIGELKNREDIPARDIILYILENSINSPDKSVKELFRGYFNKCREEIQGVTDVGIALRQPEFLLEISKELREWGFEGPEDLPYIYDINTDRFFDVKLTDEARGVFRLLGSEWRDLRPGASEVRKREQYIHRVYNREDDIMEESDKREPEKIFFEYKTKCFGKEVKAWLVTNPFPIFKGHFQLAWPENTRQRMRLEFLRLALEFIYSFSGMSGYHNTIGANSSQNHLNIQFFPEEDCDMALDKAETDELFVNSGVKVSVISKNKRFPATGFVFEPEKRDPLNRDNLAIMIQAFLDDISIKNIPFNMVFRNGKVYVFPRNPLPVGEFGQSFAGAEFIGYFLLTAGELLYTPWIKAHPEIMNVEHFNKIQEEIEKGINVTENKQELDIYIEQAVEHISLADIREAYKRVCLDRYSEKFMALAGDLRMIAKIMEMKSSPLIDILRKIRSEELYFMLILLHITLNPGKDAVLCDQIDFLIEREEMRMASRQLEMDIYKVEEEIKEWQCKHSLTEGYGERKNIKNKMKEKVERLKNLSRLLKDVKTKYFLEKPIAEVIHMDLKELLGPVVKDIEDGNAGISSTGKTDVQTHRVVNRLIAGSPRYLLHEGKVGKLGIERYKTGRKEDKDRSNHIIGVIAQKPKVELPLGLGEIDIHYQLVNANIFWVKTKPRAPPVEGHAGAKRNAIYLICESLEAVSDSDLLLVLVEEIVEVAVKEGMLDRGVKWTEELAKSIHESASGIAGDYVQAIRPIDYEKLMGEFCGKYMPILKELLQDPSRADELNDLINHLNARAVLRKLNSLEPASISLFEDERSMNDTQRAIDSIINGEVAILLFAAGQANRFNEGMVESGKITEEEANSPAYRIWNLDLWDVAKKLDSPVPPTARHIKLGVRHMMAYVEGLEDELRRLGRSEDDIHKAKQNLKFAITVNNDIIKDVETDLKKNNFFGLNPDNIVLIMNDLANGFVIENGRFILSDDPNHKTNYNHGFNLINGNIPRFSYGYNRETCRFEVLEGKGFDYLREKGAKTSILQRVNDSILLVSKHAVDVDMLGVWHKRRRETDANCMVEVLNNPQKQKGGLAVTDSSHEPYMYLIEGLSVKTNIVDKAMDKLNKKVADSDLPFAGVPYNRMYMYFDIAGIQEALDKNDGLMPMSIKHKNGAISPEIPVGDVTSIPGVKTVAIARRHDALIDEGIVPENKYYEKNSGEGACIHDFKELKDLEEALDIIAYMDICEVLRPSGGLKVMKFWEDSFTSFKDDPGLKKMLLSFLKTKRVPAGNLWLYILENLESGKGLRELFKEYFANEREKLYSEISGGGVSLKEGVTKRLKELNKLSEDLWVYGFTMGDDILPFAYDVETDRLFREKLIEDGKGRVCFLGSRNRDNRPGSVRARERLEYTHRIYGVDKDVMESPEIKEPEKVAMKYDGRFFGEEALAWIVTNPFPIFKNHFQLIWSENVRQNLSLGFLRLGLEFIKDWGDDLTGFFNSIGANASQNHPHIQFYPEDDFNMGLDTVEAEEIFEDEDLRIYSIKDDKFLLTGFIFDPVDYKDPARLDLLAIVVQAFVEDIMVKNIPFNIVFRKGKVYVLPRKPLPVGEFGQSFAGAEMIGHLLLTGKELLYTPWIQTHHGIMNIERYNSIQKELMEKINVEKNREIIRDYVDQARKNITFQDVRGAYKRVCLDRDSQGFKALLEDLKLLLVLIKGRNGTFQELREKIMDSPDIYIFLIFLRVIIELKDPDKKEYIDLYNRISEVIEREEISLGARQLELDIGILKSKGSDASRLEKLLDDTKNEYSLDLDLKGFLQERGYNEIIKLIAEKEGMLRGSSLVRKASGEEVPLEKEEEIEPYIQMAEGVLDRLRHIYGPGISVRLEKIQIVKNLNGGKLYPQGRAPLASYRDGVLKIDELLFQYGEWVVFEELEHELLESIGEVIPGSNEILSDVVATLRNVLRFLDPNLGVTDERYKVDPEEYRKSVLNALADDLIDPDGEYLALLAVILELQEGSNLSHDFIIASVVGYVMRTKLYETVRGELGLPEDLGLQLKILNPLLDDALSVFNEIVRAKQGGELVQKVAETELLTLAVVKTFTGAVRITGLERLGRRLAGIIAASVKVASKLGEIASLPMAMAKEQFCIVLDKNRIPDEMGQGWEKEIARLKGYRNADDKQLFEVVYSLEEAQANGYRGKSIIHLIDPGDIKEEMLEGILYLPMPYLRSSLYMAAMVAVADGEVSKINPLVKGLIGDLYSQILGRSITGEDLQNLFTAPWLILPEIRSVIGEINRLRRAIAEIEAAA